MGTAPPNASSRRAVVRGAAWTAPVIAVAAAAPAFAGSQNGRLTFNPSITFDAGGNKTYNANAVIDPGGVLVTTLQVRFTLTGTTFTDVGALPADPDGAGPLLAPWTGVISGGGTIITYTYNLVPLAANAPDITQLFAPVRQTNSSRALKIELIINGTVASTVNYTNP